jgi:4-hydroxy-tetrahydrodipicolinate reductase
MTPSPLRIGMHGASGRMGQAVLALVAATPDLRIGAAWVAPGDPVIGRPSTGHAAAPPFSAASELAAGLAACDVVVDFSRPEPALGLFERAAALGVPVVSGTTGFDAEGLARLERSAQQVALLHASNMSVGVSLLLGLLEQAARALGPEFDAEILEMHHRHKVDAPSGTALALGEAVARGRGRPLAELARYERVGQTGARPVGEVGFATLRGGDVVGDHTVIFAGDGERIELGHRAGHRGIFASGALRAARWIVGRPPGRYGMKDVLGLGRPDL